jgi:regulator of replication initiation timing
MLCCLLPLLFAFADVAWILEWGYLSLAVCFILCFGIYLFFTSPLGGKLIYISYDQAYIGNSREKKEEISALRERIERMMESEARKEAQVIGISDLLETGGIEISDLQERLKKMREESQTKNGEISKRQGRLQQMEEENAKRKTIISCLASTLRKMGAQVTVSDTISEKSRPHCRIHFTEIECKISRRSLFSSHRCLTKTKKIPSGMFSTPGVATGMAAGVADIIKKMLDG